MSDYENINELISSLVEAKNSKDIADKIHSYQAAFAYQGFDPVLVTKLIVEACTARKLKVKEFASICIAILVLRGTKLEKIKQKSTDSLKRHIEQLQSIVTNKRGGSLGRKDITLPRVAACFPELTARIAMKNGRSVLPDFMNLHALIQSPYLAAILPGGSTFSDVAWVNFAWNVKFDQFVSPKNPTEMMRLMGYWKNSHVSMVLNDSQRQDLCTELEVKPDSCKEWLTANMFLISGIPRPPMDTILKKAYDMGSFDFENTIQGRFKNDDEKIDANVPVSQAKMESGTKTLGTSEQAATQESKARTSSTATESAAGTSTVTTPSTDSYSPTLEHVAKWNKIVEKYRLIGPKNEREQLEYERAIKNLARYNEERKK